VWPERRDVPLKLDLVDVLRIAGVYKSSSEAFLAEKQKTAPSQMHEINFDND